MIFHLNPLLPLSGSEVGTIICPEEFSQFEEDCFWMARAYQLAEQAASIGEVPVGAVLVEEGRLVAQGYNLSIVEHDPTAHAEIIALRQAGKLKQNYRLLNLTLYVTLEPCAMCAMAMVHARIKRLVYGADDLKTGAVRSHFHLVQSSQLNHHIEVVSGVLAQECSTQLSLFFKERRANKKREKQRLALENP